MYVSCVQPVAMHSAVFCTGCSFCMLVVDAMGDRSVLDVLDAVLSMCLLYMSFGLRGVFVSSVLLLICSVILCCIMVVGVFWCV